MPIAGWVSKEEGVQLLSHRQGQRWCVWSLVVLLSLLTLPATLHMPRRCACAAAWQ